MKGKRLAPKRKTKESVRQGRYMKAENLADKQYQGAKLNRKQRRFIDSEFIRMHGQTPSEMLADEMRDVGPHPGCSEFM